MALAIIITLEKLPAEEPLSAALTSYSKAATGKALARESDRLDLAAARYRVTPITSMLSENQAALIAQMIEEGFDPAKMRLPPEVWFTAAEGLATVRALIEHVTANLNDFKQPNPILKDLKAAQALLNAAETTAARFHFSKVTL